MITKTGRRRHGPADLDVNVDEDRRRRYLMS
jgi:hypothetical protein